jgi:threonine/homoserine/homoserine lactone efflux protein
MSFEVWIVFVVTETALCLTPGPAVLLVLSQALMRGTTTSLWSNAGILAGNTFYFVLSATGLGAVLLASYDVFFAIKWLGAAYLVWIGVSTFLGGSATMSIPVSGARGGRGARALADGFMLQVANPKALVFFTALLPQFIDPSGSVAWQVTILAVTSVVIEFFVLAGYGTLAGRFTGRAIQPRFATLTNRVAGSLLVTAGAGMATLRRS